MALKMTFRGNIGAAFFFLQRRVDCVYLSVTVEARMLLVHILLSADQSSNSNVLLNFGHFNSNLSVFLLSLSLSLVK